MVVIIVFELWLETKFDGVHIIRSDTNTEK